MNKQSQRGFTLIEVVLAIAVGLIIIAGVSVGYSYAKRAAITDNERKDAAAIKSFVEQAIASNQANMASGQQMTGCASGVTICAPDISRVQFMNLAKKLPSLAVDPYTGACRLDDCTAPTTTVSCGNAVGCIDVSTQTASVGPWTNVTDVGMASHAGGLGAAVLYIRQDNPINTISLTLADGTVKSCNSYAVVESDGDGNLVVAECGSSTS